MRATLYVCAYHRDGSGWDECSSDHPCDPGVRLDRIAAPAEDDWTCLCGNTAWAGEGFFPCLADGTSVEPDINGPWEGRLVKCERCGRIMDQSTWDGATVTVVGEEVPA